MTILTALTIVATMLPAAGVGEWYDKATESTIAANKTMMAAMQDAQTSMQAIEQRRGAIKTREDLLLLTADMRSMVRTLQSRLASANKKHVQSRRFLKNSTFADEVKSGDPLHKTMADRINMMQAKLDSTAQVLTAIHGQIDQTEAIARKSHPKSKGELDAAVAAYRQARQGVDTALRQSQQVVEQLRTSKASLPNSAAFKQLTAQINATITALETAIQSARRDSTAARTHLNKAIVGGEVEGDGETRQTLLAGLTKLDRQLTNMQRALQTLRTELANLARTAEQMQAANANQAYQDIYKKYQQVETSRQQIHARLNQALDEARAAARRGAPTPATDPLLTRLQTQQKTMKTDTATAQKLNANASVQLSRSAAASNIATEALRSLERLLEQQRSHLQALAIAVDKLAAQLNYMAKPTKSAEPAKPTPTDVQDLIEKHSGILGLDEESLAKELREAGPANAKLVAEVIKALDRDDRDDVAQYFLTGASDEEIAALGRAPGGDKALAIMAAELADGWNTSGEDEQRERIFEALATGDAPKGAYSESAAEAKQQARNAKQPAATDMIDRHTSYLNLDEAKIGAELITKAQKDPVLVEKVLDELGSTDRDDVSLAMLEKATDTQIMQMANTPQGRETVLRMVSELHAGDKDDDERAQMQRAMKLITAADRAKPGATPPKIEVLTFVSGASIVTIAGQAVGAQGHTAIVVGDLVYSFEAGWRTGVTKSEYLRQNAHRSAIGQVLDLPASDVTTIQNMLNKAAGTGVYAVTGNVCTSSASNMLNHSLGNLPDTWNPPHFVGELDNTGKVGDYKLYPSGVYEP